MRSRDILGMFFILGGLALWTLGWSEHRYWACLLGGLLLAAGLRLAWKKRRAPPNHNTAVDGGQEAAFWSVASWDGEDLADACADSGSAGDACADGGSGGGD